MNDLRRNIKMMRKLLLHNTKAHVEFAEKSAIKDMNVLIRKTREMATTEIKIKTTTEIKIKMTTEVNINMAETKTTLIRIADLESKVIATIVTFQGIWNNIVTKRREITTMENAELRMKTRMLLQIQLTKKTNSF